MTITQGASLAGDNSWPTGPLRSGPMLGEVSPVDAFVWAQACSTQALTLTLHRPDGTTQTDVQTPTAAGGLCVVFHVTGLASATSYSYSIAAGPASTPLYTLRTAPLPAARQAKIVFGSCNVLPAEPGSDAIFTAIVDEHPTAVVMTGDNAYLDGHAGSENAMLQVLLSYRNDAQLRKVLPGIPVLGIWDDHDYGGDNSDANFTGKIDALDAFKHVWAQRAYGLAATPGIFSSVRLGPVEVFLTDGRYQRQGAQILGTAQMAWLQGVLLASTAPVKLIVSGSVVLPQFVKTIVDSVAWDGWESSAPGELAALLGYIEAHHIQGVLFASGDLHIGYLVRRAGTLFAAGQQGPDYWEVVASPLTKPIWGTHVRNGSAAPTYDPTCLQEVVTQNYGVLDVDLDRLGSEIVIALRNPQGATCATRAIDIGTLRNRPAHHKTSAVVWPGGKAYFFKDDRYMRYSMEAAHEGVDAGYPLAIAGHWPRMPAGFTRDLDAAVQWPNGKAYFFKGNGYVRYTLGPDEGVDTGYPKYLAENWPGLWPDGIDAAVVWPNGKAYFFRGKDYLRYTIDPAHEGVDPGYPRPIAASWPGLAQAFPSGIDAAVVWPNGKAYFFKGDRYVRYTVDPAHEGVDPGYPRPIADGWPGLGNL